MTLDDIMHPDELGHRAHHLSVNFALTLDELDMLSQGLKLLYIKEYDTDRADEIRSMREGLAYAYHTLQGVVDDVIREKGEI